MIDPDDYDMRQVQDDHERWVEECEQDPEYWLWVLDYTEESEHAAQ